MKEIKLKGLDISAYTEKLRNGLEIYFIPYTNKKNYFVSYATRYGSIVTRFTPVGSKEEIKVPDGIAHFLEHKMFEQEDGVDPFSYFSESGTGSNASTSFDNTQYICYGTKNFEDNLRYLLKFVNSPYFTADNVEKEKGIISEELKMYEDIPEFKLEMKLRENVYHNDSRRIDIGGTIPEIMKITKEDLYNCYNNFYVPRNMFLLVVGNFDRDKALEIIKEEVGNKDNRVLPTIKKVREKKAVRVKDDEFKASIKTPKLGIGVKIPIKDLGETDDLTLDLYLTMISTLCFGSASLFRERVRNKKLLSSFYTEWETTDDYKVFYIMAASDDIDELFENIKEEFNNLEIMEDAFNRMKKVWIANEVKMIDYIDSTVRNVFDDILHYGKIIPDKLDRIRKMDFNTIKRIADKIDFTNMSVIRMVSTDEN